MHPEIENLINMALADGQVTDKEREIILRKAEKLGIDIEEVEMIIEGEISSNKTIIANKVNSKLGKLSKRNFILREVKYVKPASLNKELEINNLISEFKKSRNEAINHFKNYFSEANKIYNELNNINYELKENMKNMNQEYETSKNSCIKKILDSINFSISEKFGKTKLIIDNPSKLIGLRTQEIIEIISKDGKWEIIELQTKRNKVKMQLYFAMLIILLFHLIIVITTGFKNTLWLALPLAFYAGYIRDRIKNKHTNFTSGDINNVLLEVIENNKNEINNITKMKNEIIKLDLLINKIGTKTISKYESFMNKINSNNEKS